MARKTKQTEARTADPDGLTDKQLAFIDHYLGDCKLNASKAALKAGYATRQDGARLKANAVIRARIDQYLTESAMRRDEVLEMLVDDALFEPDDVLSRRDMNALDPIVKSALVSGRLGARTSARQSLAKAYGLFSDRVGEGANIEITIRGADTEKL